MTPAQLRKALIRLYGKGSTYHLAREFAGDTGISHRGATYWLDGARAIPPYIPLVIEALEAREERAKARGLETR